MWNFEDKRQLLTPNISVEYNGLIHKYVLNLQDNNFWTIKCICQDFESNDHYKKENAISFYDTHHIETLTLDSPRLISEILKGN